MSEMILQYNSPDIYILGSTHKVQDVNLDGLFASPAGRELVKQNTEYHHKTKIKQTHDFRKNLPTLGLLDETSARKEAANHKAYVSLLKKSLGLSKTDAEANEEDQKSNHESLYEEQMKLLIDFDCLLEDDCRCLECQSTYFDYTDDDDLDEHLDNYSSISNRRRHSNQNMYCCIQ